jgi:polyisoprenoid-binding protein YceI
MLHRTSAAVLSLAIAASALASGPNRDPKAAPKGLYAVEPTHTSVCFTIQHMGLSAYPGCFTQISGSLGFDGADPKLSKLDIEIALDSVTTASDRLNGKLRGEFFNTAANKTATFRSSSATVTGPGTGTVTGDLTIGGKTKPVTLTVVFNGGLQHPMAGVYALGFDATATIKRSDFGLDTVSWSAFVSDEVKLVIAAEFLAK